MPMKHKHGLLLSLGCVVLLIVCGRSQLFAVPASQPADSTTSAASRASESADLRRIIAGLQRQLAELKRENADLRKENESLRARVPATQPAVNAEGDGLAPVPADQDGPGTYEISYHGTARNARDLFYSDRVEAKSYADALRKAQNMRLPLVPRYDENGLAHYDWQIKKITSAKKK